MALLQEVSDEIWAAIAPLISASKRERVALAMIEVLEEYEAEDLEGSALYEAAYPEKAEYDDEDGLNDDEDY